MHILLIVRQVEFYLSPTNLPYDTHLNHHIDPQGWFPLSLIVTYPRMQKLHATDPYQVALALRVYSTFVIVDSTATKIRPNWHYLPNPALYEPKTRIPLQQRQHQQQPASHVNPPLPQNTLHWPYPTTLVMFPAFTTHPTQPFPPVSNYPPFQPQYYSSSPANPSYYPSSPQTPSQNFGSPNTTATTPRPSRRRRRFAKNRNHTHANPRLQTASPHRHSTPRQPGLVKSDFPPLNISPPSDSSSRRGKETSILTPVKEGWVSVVKASNGKVADAHVQPAVLVGDTSGAEEGSERKRTSLETEKLQHDVADVSDNHVGRGTATDVDGKGVGTREAGKRDVCEDEAVVERAALQEGNLEMIDTLPREDGHADEHAVRAEVLDTRAEQRKRNDAGAEDADWREIGKHEDESNKAVVQPASACDGDCESGDVSLRIGRLAEDHAIQVAHSEGKGELTNNASPPLYTRESTICGETFPAGEKRNDALSSQTVDNVVKKSSVPCSTAWANAPKSLFTPTPTPSAFSPRPTQPLQLQPKIEAFGRENANGGKRLQGDLRGGTSQSTGGKFSNDKVLQPQGQPSSGQHMSLPRVHGGGNKGATQQWHGRRWHDERNGTIVATNCKKDEENGLSRASAKSEHHNDCSLPQEPFNNSTLKTRAKDDIHPILVTPISQASGDDADKVTKIKLNQSNDLNRAAVLKPNQAGLDTASANGGVQDVIVANTLEKDMKMGEEIPIDQPNLHVQVASVAKVTPIAQPSSIPKSAASISAMSRM